MQNAFANPPQWLQLALAAVVSLVAREGIVKFYSVWLSRHKPASEIHVTEATATEITVRAGSTAGEAVIKMLARLEVAQQTIDRLREDGQATIDRLRSERDEWEMKAFDLELELRDSRTANALLTAQSKIDNHYIRKQAAFIEARGLHEAYIALDAPREGEDA